MSSNPGVKVIFRKNDYIVLPHKDMKKHVSFQKREVQFLWMSHEINLVALKMRMPSSVTSVFPVSGKLRLSAVSHTLDTGDLVLRDQHQYLMQHCIEKLGVSWCHYYALDPLSKIVIDMLKF